MEELWNVLHFIFLINTQGFESFAFLSEVWFSSFRTRQACPANRITYGLEPQQIVTETIYIPRYNPFTECSVRATVSKMARML